MNIYFVLTLNGWGYIKQDAIYCVLQIDTTSIIQPVSFFGYQEVNTTSDLSTTSNLTFVNYTNQSYLVMDLLPDYTVTSTTFDVKFNLTRTFLTTNKLSSVNPIDLY